MHALFYIDGGEYKPELLDTPDAALTKDAEPATTCLRIEFVVAIHSLASDFENMSYSFGADTEDRKRAQGSIKHAMAVANKHNQNGAGCITHPSAPNQAQWQLIETAPHGKVILGFIPHSMGGYVCPTLRIELGSWNNASCAAFSEVNPNWVENLAVNLLAHHVKHLGKLLGLLVGLMIWMIRTCLFDRKFN